MAFLESPRFPDRLAVGVAGGPGFNTSVIRIQSGRRIAAVNWDLPLRTWSVRHIPVNDRGSYLALQNHFMAVRGMAHGFRLRDPFDYADEGAGLLGTTGAGTGLPTAQLVKQYGLPGFYSQRPIYKPLAVVVRRNGSPVAVGVGAGQIALNSTTGLVTFVADASSGIASITPGATTSVTLSAAVGVLTAGTLYLSGISGTVGTALNGKAWSVNSVSGATYTLAVNTAGLSGSGGLGSRYPQPTDALTWTGEFDTPVYFTSDEFRPEFVGRDVISFPDLGIEEARQL